MWARNKLWMTGRGVDLLRVEPVTGAIETDRDRRERHRRGGAGDQLVVPARNAEVDERGFSDHGRPQARLQRDRRAVTTLAQASGRVAVHGIATQKGFVWLADNTAGRLYRLPLGGA